jgi:hypothetical protein
MATTTSTAIGRKTAHTASSGVAIATPSLPILGEKSHKVIAQCPFRIGQ